MKTLGLSKIRLKVIEILRSFRTEDHTLHSMEAMDNVRDSNSHISNGNPLLPEVAGNSRSLKGDVSINFLEDLPGWKAPPSLRFDDKGD